jgi:hypothetical protein
MPSCVQVYRCVHHVYTCTDVCHHVCHAVDAPPPFVCAYVLYSVCVCVCVCGRGRRGGGEGRGGIDTPEEGDGEEEVARAGAALTKHDTHMCFRPICFQFPDACEEEEDT